MSVEEEWILLKGCKTMKAWDSGEIIHKRILGNAEKSHRKKKIASSWERVGRVNAC